MADPSGSGALSVSEVVEGALYDPERGFYERGGRAGRRGDFLTSPEVGPLFGALLGRALDGWWDDLGRPDPFVVHEHGAGPGTLARTVVAGRPRCGPALRWVLVERAAAQRTLHPAHLPHVGDLAAAEAGDAWAVPGGGPQVASTGAAPTGPAHVAVANELLDNLPFDLAERTADGWREVRVVPASGAEVLAALDPDRSTLLGRVAPAAAVGARVPLQDAAVAWVVATRERLAPGGRLLVLDYGSTTAALAARPWTSWVRTYRGQQRGGPPFTDLGTQDVTVEVAVDQLAEGAGPPRTRSQADALRAWGLDDLVAEARSAPPELAGPGALEALRLRSRIREAEALTDPHGLGSFHVWEWPARI